MGKAHDRGRLDWLVEVAGASAPAIATAFAVARLAPLNGWPVTSAMVIGSGAMFALAFAAMRVIRAEARHLALPEFEAAAVQEDELLLDQVYRGDWALETLLLNQRVDAASEAIAELLLDDPLPVPAPNRAWCNCSPTAGCRPRANSRPGSTGILRMAARPRPRSATRRMR